MPIITLYLIIAQAAPNADVVALTTAQKVLTRTLVLDSGSAEFWDRTFANVRIVGASSVVRKDAGGGVLFVRRATVPGPLRPLGGWAIDAETAWASAVVEAPPVRYSDPKTARQNGAVFRRWLATTEGLVPVWIVHQASPIPLWSFETVIDGRDGSVRSTVNRVRRAERANIFDYDPGVDRDMSATTEVTLTPSPTTRLRSDTFDINTCCITEGCAEGASPIKVPVQFGQINARLAICDERAMASPDDNGDWLFTPTQTDLRSSGGTFATPIRADINDPNAPHRDSFAEVQGYYHAHRFMAHLSDHGLAEFQFDNRTRRSINFRLTVNYLMPSIPFGGQAEALTLSGLGCLNIQTMEVNCFYPFDNAAYIPAVGQGTGNVDLPIDRPYDSVLMFQGVQSKFVYAADILYHELTHAVIGSTSNLNGGVADSWGAHPTPGALNEGFADYAALSLTENPVLGRYAQAGAEGAIRRLEPARSCPTDLTGEIHDDGAVWASSLWAFRQGLDAADRSGFDRAVLIAMTTMVGRNASYDDAAEAVIQELSISMDADAAEALHSHLTTQGMLACERLRPLNTEAAEIPQNPIIERLHLSAADSFGLRRGTFVPAPYQLLIHLPAGTRSAQLAWTEKSGGQAGGIPGGGENTDDGAIEAVVRLNERITFTYQGGETSHDGQATYEAHRRGTSARVAITDLDLACAAQLIVSLGTTGSARVLEDIQLFADIDDDLAAECNPPAPPPVAAPAPAEGCNCGSAPAIGLWAFALIAGLRRRRTA
jgi:hypothetical protein